MGNLSIIP